MPLVESVSRPAKRILGAAAFLLSVAIYTAPHANVRASTMAPFGTLADTLQKSFGTGNNHNCQLDTNGAVKCWGDNSLGQLGQGNTTAVGTKVTVSGLTSGFTQVTVGNSHSCALKSSDGSVWCWGYNRSLGIVGKGLLGANIESTPVQVQKAAGSLLNVVDVEADIANTCAVTSTGEVWCWGDNYAGQLGTGSSTPSASGAAVRIMSSGAKAVSVGNMSSCALTTSGGVKCWGANNNKQIGNVSATTYNNAPTDATGLTTGVLNVTVGQDNACALLGSNVVKCWGQNLFGAVGNGSSGAGTDVATPTNALNMPTGVVSLGGAYSEMMAMTADGKLWRWGNGSAPNNIATQEWAPMAGVTVVAFQANRTSWSASCYMLSDLRLFCSAQNTGITPLNPGGPSTPTIAVQPADGRVTVTPTPGNGGGPVASYVVTATPGGATCTVTLPATSCDITSLTNGTQYTFTATATNAIANSASSSSVTGTPMSAPTTPTISAQPGDGQAIITVVPGNGGGTPSSYLVTATPGGATCTVTSPATTCTVSPLTNGTQYTFSATASNGSGISASSSNAIATPIALPAPPTIAVAAGNGNASVTVTPGYGGGAVSTYVVTATPGGAICTITSPATTCTISGLTNGTSYSFAVAASNAAGSTNGGTANASPVAPTTTTVAPSSKSGSSAPTSTIAPATSGTSASSSTADTSSQLAGSSSPVEDMPKSGGDLDLMWWSYVLLVLGFSMTYASRLLSKEK